MNRIFTLILILSFVSCNNEEASDTLEKIQYNQTLTVGYIPYYDVTFKDIKNNQLEGFLVELLKAVARKMNIPWEKIKFIETDWQGFGLGVNNNKFDFSIAGTFKTKQRENIVRFTRPIFYLGNGAVVKAEDNRFNDINDFDKKGITIAVIQGEQGYEFAKKNFQNAKLIELSGSDLSLAPLQVKNGMADAAFSDQYILKRYVTKNPDLKDALEFSPYYVLPVCWAVSKDKEDSRLLKKLNEIILELENDGFIDSLKNVYSQRIPFADNYINEKYE
ncbi:MAG: ABC transporter substrate-binding protein [Bacteroidota bacterium]